MGGGDGSNGNASNGEGGRDDIASDREQQTTLLACPPATHILLCSPISNNGLLL